MSHGMVAHKMSCRMDRPRNLRALADEAANQKERGTNIVCGQYIQQLLRVGVVGTVIVGQRKFARITAADNGFAEDLRGRPHGGVGISTGGEGRCGSGSGKSGEHWV